MFKGNLKQIGMAAGLSLTLIAAGCGSDDASSDGGSESIGEQLDYEITAIEAGAGVVKAAEKAVSADGYDLSEWEVATSSSGAMTQELENAYKDEEPIIVTGWSPHWKFSKYELEYLEDPEKVFGAEEQIKTMARQGLEEDMPNAYTILDQFAWTTEDMEAVMLERQEGTEIEEAAKNWVSDNEEEVAKWTEGAEEVDGKSIELVYVNWDSEIASTNVIKEVLTQQGFEVEITALDNAGQWEAVSSGQADAMVGAWLPGTHGDLYEEHKESLADLGANLEGAKIGLVVPSYMDISSIEDLKSE
ncbi:glycine/betaine ABC transporter [Pontibacillus halophilus JSM 076056 = DSM 19796]|uniref:Glycine/betaine ABC transporter n=1 Tax=Pontibacillus halophilus JSM 076056 = DSM 19796 TaxID=1385510 RepID=A0A0A5GKV8_9BACI|nr:glycine betaine ABC transporter substrate-binding protein [Pontibacillus halophilus]KGX92609.1 glycine/betaine ABC transporter [Pontibacillus halophilus JSM 076056 = DSM 19796]